VSNHRVVSPWCTQSLAFIELPVDKVNNSQGFNVLLVVHHFVRNVLWQNAEAAEKGHIFQLVGIFSAHRVAHAAHRPSRYNQS
jgi:hypothetical protein